MINVRCNLCHADDYRVIYDSTIGSTIPTVEEYTSTANRYCDHSRIVSCNSCGLIYANPRDANIKSIYKEVVDSEYIESWEDRAVTFKKHLKILRCYKNGSGNLLDIGCYAGIFPAEAKGEGYNITAIEPSRWACEVAREKTGIEVLQGSWDEVNLPNDYFDVVTMWDVVEHLEDPSACFRQIFNWLRKDGIVAITTHNIKSLFARLLGQRYPWLMRFHFYHFEPKTLSAMLFENSLVPVTVKYYVKKFSLRYLLGRLGVKTHSRLFKKINMSLNTGDMFMIIARKSDRK